MASVIWDVGRAIQDSYVSLFDAVNNPDKYSKEDLLRLIETEAEDLKATYQDLAEDHGWK